MSLTLADFFQEKVKKIMTSIPERLIGIIPDPMRNDEIHAGERLHVLNEVTETEVENSYQRCLVSRHRWTLCQRSSSRNVRKYSLSSLPDWLTSLFRKVGFHRALKRLK